jgi:hypothetical protein
MPGRSLFTKRVFTEGTEENKASYRLAATLVIFACRGGALA